MLKKIEAPSIICAAGSPPKTIEEFIGRVNSDTGAVSIARMSASSGWEEPGQRPDFTEYTIVLTGMVRVASEAGTMDVAAGEAVIAPAGEWVRYSTPGSQGAEYISVCMPAFSPETVHRDE
jgi:mannose-6-phosphate isomerase-like protein (cupin superfamily)